VAYTPLSKKVADALHQRAAKDDHHPPFDWDTPERTRQMVHNQITPQKKPAARGMSNQQIIRELRKLKRAQ
jgi:hypothetical protein